MLDSGRILFVGLRGNFGVYDPTADSWGPVGKVPVDAFVTFAAQSTTDAVFLGANESCADDKGGNTRLCHHAFMLDIHTGMITRRAELPPDTLGGRNFAFMLPCGEVLVWGRCLGGTHCYPYTNTDLPISFLYDPVKDKWTYVDSTPAYAIPDARAVQTTDRSVVIAFGFFGSAAERSFPLHFGPE